MKRRMTGKNLARTIKNSFGRYLAIALIIALGAALFMGLLATKMDMVATGQNFLDGQNMFDLRLVSTYGWTESDVEQILQMPGVKHAEGQTSLDALVYREDAKESAVYHLHAIPETINKVYLQGGRMPQKPNECLLDGFHVGDEVLGLEIQISEENSDETKEKLSCHSYTVVGYVSTPLYMDMSRGSTSLGSGEVAGFLYFMPEAFAMDGVYTEIAVTMEEEYAIYSKAFTKAMEDMAERLEPQLTVLAQERYLSIRLDAQTQYDEGLAEYEQGRQEYEGNKSLVLQKLSDALQELEDGQKEIDEGWAVLQDGYQKLSEGQAELDEQAALLQSSREELLAAKTDAYQQLADALAELTVKEQEVRAGLAQLEEGLALLEDGITQIDDGIAQIQDGLAQIEEALPQLELAITLKQTEVTVLQAALSAAEGMPNADESLLQQLRDQLLVAQQELDDYLLQQQQALTLQQELTVQLAQLQTQRQELVTQKTELEATKDQAEEGLRQIQDGYTQIQSNQIAAELQFAALEAQLDAGQLQLDAAQKELDAGRAELDAGADELRNAQAQLDAGRTEYEAGKLEAETQLADAEVKLLEGAQALAEAKEAIDSLEPAQLFILDRNTNTGYIALDNNSDIVSGVSRVFPVFFLLVAALVCITTMTRMVEEERTQIGTMKALGYSNWRIISKYIYYSGSAAIFGCGLGAVLGSLIFPSILWNAYKILFNITPRIVLKMDWTLCAIVVLAYTSVMLLVTWYCCHKSLREAPAELIRPKAPTVGKKTFLEYLPFWKKLSFLNKVMLRNVVRYRQRMFMMLIGVGGCTALLLTGFGLRDSLVNIATDQFEQVTVYDLAVYFDGSQPLEQQEAFLEAIDPYAERAMFYYQTGVELDFDNSVRELSLIVAPEGVTDFVKFNSDGNALPLPGVGEVLLSEGIAENMGISVGDGILLRDSQMRTLQLTVSGIYDNMVSNYAYVTPETYAAQLGTEPGYQMAFVNVMSHRDIHDAAAFIGQQEKVMNVMICQDTAQQVTSMLEALDLLVLTVVICAGALAVIVLYNLTNININERIREIATIKVLGFHAVESALYVFKENLLLSVLGVGAGLLMGKYLLAFVVSQIKVDIVFFSPQISFLSCVLSVVLTILSALLVDFILYFRLNKINMAEALKSVE